MITRFAVLLLLLWPFSAQAKPLVADLSQYNIAIDSSFTGANLILFGARQAAGDVVVVVRGPMRHYTLRKKERVAGIWINRTSMELYNIPDYYAIASTKPLERLLSPETLQTLQIGIPHLPYLAGEQNKKDSKLTLQQQLEFENAFIADRLAKRLYVDNQQTVNFMGDTLFKTILPFPDITPRGGYTAETYLIYDRQIVGMQATPLHVAKSGLDAVIFELAHKHPALYGILAVLMAISAGWLASVIFRKL